MIFAREQSTAVRSGPLLLDPEQCAASTARRIINTAFVEQSADYPRAHAQATVSSRLEVR